MSDGFPLNLSFLMGRDFCDLHALVAGELQHVKQGFGLGCELAVLETQADGDDIFTSDGFAGGLFDFQGTFAAAER